MSLQNDIVSMQIFNFIIIIHNVNGYSVNICNTVCHTLLNCKRTRFCSKSRKEFI